MQRKNVYCNGRAELNALHDIFAVYNKTILIIQKYNYKTN